MLIIHGFCKYISPKSIFNISRNEDFTPSENWICSDLLRSSSRPTERLASAVVCSGRQRDRLVSLDGHYGSRRFENSVTCKVNVNFENTTLCAHGVLDL